MSDTVVTIKLSMWHATVVLEELQNSKQFYQERSRDKNITSQQRREAAGKTIVIQDIIQKISG